MFKGKSETRESHRPEFKDYPIIDVHTHLEMRRLLKGKGIDALDLADKFYDMVGVSKAVILGLCGEDTQKC